MAPAKERKEYLWGYGSGVAAATTPDYGDVVLAEFTQPFNENDITYYRPLYLRAVVASHLIPTHITADAAMMHGTSTRPACIMVALPLSRSTNMDTLTPGAMSMVCRCAPRGCACMPPTSSLTPMAT